MSNHHQPRAERPAIQYLQECFLLLEDGALIWRERPISHFSSAANAATTNKQRSGNRSGIVGKDGYVIVRVARKLFPAHIIVWAICNGSWPENEIDHRDRDRSNNRPSNLRLASRPQNMANMPAHRDNKTGLKGVHEHTPNRFRARIRHAGRVVDLGLFDSAGLAHQAYRDAEKKLKGDFSS